MTAGSAVDAARVLAVRDRILASPEFNVVPDWRTRLLDWFIDHLQGLGGLLPTAGRALALVLLAGVLIAVGTWLWPRRLRGQGGAQRAEAAPAVARGFAGLRSDARRAAGEGRLAEAVRLTWLAALALLDEKGISAADDGGMGAARTRRDLAARADWEHVAAARRRGPQLADPLADLALEFQRVRFGAAPLAAASAERCLALLGTLEDRAAHG